MPDCRARRQRFKETQFKTFVDTLAQHKPERNLHKKTFFVHVFIFTTP